MMKENKYKPYKTALVGLDLTEMDDHLVQYAAMISKVFPMERIFFVHVAKDLQLPDDLLKEYPGLLDPLDDSIETDIQKNVDQHFEGSAVETVCIVKEGNPIEKMLKLSKVKDVDLILMGRKKSLQGSGIVSSRIA
ncbi:MAG: universal stress protein, partial [Cyclobacteriaceae bacterium]|nr:universal stress protein [Cyclobacteriaceae bacterium HetDA_MAG_MS6]